jgi:hypothetical protein
MDVPQLPSPGQGATPEPAPVVDPRLQPSPDYGTLGPGSDIPAAGADSDSGPIHRTPQKPRAAAQLFVVMLGVLLAILVANKSSAQGAWSRFTSMFSLSGSSASPSAKDSRQLDRLKPQKQAEALLELAVARSDGAVDQISSRVDRWQGKLKWDSQIATLTTAALNSNDMRVRESGVEVELAAYGLGKNSASLDYVLRMSDSPDHAEKIWALWAIGLLGNRGVQTGRVMEVLTSHLKDQDEDSRRWAVEGIALVGTTPAIVPLLQAMHDDPSPAVRERAACSLAESGLFTHEQRLGAIPQLLNYTDDPSLDSQTHAWAFQALTDITRQHLPNDPAAWRSWYNSTRTE